VLKTSPEPGRRFADTYATPFLRFSQMYAPGIEIQAQFVASAYSGHAIRPLPWGWTLLLAAAALLSGVGFMQHWSAVRSSVFVLIVAPILVGASFLLFDRSDRWLRVSLSAGVQLGH
jgi:CHASE2 domain-containing sensor protein